MTCHPWQGHYCGRRAGSGLPLTVTFRCRCELLPPVSDGTWAEGAHRCGRCSDPGPSRYRQSPGQGRWPPILPVSWETSPRKLPASCRKSQPARNGNRGQETKNFELTRHDALLHPLVGSDNQRNPAVRLSPSAATGSPPYKSFSDSRRDDLLQQPPWPCFAGPLRTDSACGLEANVLTPRSPPAKATAPVETSRPRHLSMWEQDQPIPGFPPCEPPEQEHATVPPRLPPPSSARSTRSSMASRSTFLAARSHYERAPFAYPAHFARTPRLNMACACPLAAACSHQATAPAPFPTSFARAPRLNIRRW